MQKLDPGLRWLRWESRDRLGQVLPLVLDGRDAEALAALQEEIRRLRPASEGEKALNDTYQCLALLITGQAEQAAAYLQETIQRFPHLIAPRIVLSLALLRAGHFEQALAQYRAAVTLDTDPSWYDSGGARLFLLLGRAFEEAGRMDEALGFFRHALSPEGDGAFSLPGMPNPVELFLNQQPTEARRYACLHVLCELIDGEPIDFIRRGIWARRSIPHLAQVWEFLSAAPSDYSLLLEVYDGQLLDSGLSTATASRRRLIAVAFLRFCRELGYPIGEEI